MCNKYQILCRVCDVLNTMFANNKIIYDDYNNCDFQHAQGIYIIIFIVEPPKFYKISELFLITIVLTVSLRNSQSAFSVKKD